MQSSSNFSLETWLQRQFLSSLLSTPEGRALVLTQAGIAESTDEGEVFAQLATRVDDRDLQRLVRWHAQDEERHAALFLAAADRQGVPRPDVPASIQLLTHLNARLKLFGRPLTGPEDVMDAYLVLQVIEERAIVQMEMIEPVMRKYDVEAANMMLTIIKDEVRHLRYCHAITRRYAKSDARRVERLVEFRQAEAEAFRDHQQDSSKFILKGGYLPVSQAWLWGHAVDLLGGRTPLPFTRFSEETEALPLAA